MSRARTDSIKKIQAILVTRRDALRKALAGDLSLLMQLRDQSGSDVVDAALDAAQDEISSQLAEVESRELGSIENALERIRSGAYGDCEVCNKKIPVARLDALPYATMCIECQQAAEDGTLDYDRNEDWSRVVDTGFSEADTRVNDFELQ
jgi:DnaK suppressor protein